MTEIKRSKFLGIMKVLILMIIVALLFISCTRKDNKGIDINDNDSNQVDTNENKDENDNNDNSDSETNVDVDKKEDNEQVDNKKDDDEKETDSSNKEDTTPVELDYQKIKPNELGHIMVIMYHGIIDNPPYHITEEQFLEDLEYMYNNGYRTISMRDYLDNNINVEPGFTPIVLTFDDGLSSTFSLIEKDGELVVKPGTAIEILERFAKEHPGFDNKAALYINSSSVFDGAGTVEERLNWLVDNGYDLGNHTASHHKLSKKSSRELMKEIGIVDQIIKNAVPNYTVDSLTYPFGVRPKKALLNLVQNGEYKDIAYSYQVGMKEGASGPYVPPIHIKFDPFNMPRARGSKGAIQDMWWFFDYYDNQHPDRKYISDGNPNRISILAEDEDKVNKEKLGDKELYLYELE